MFGRFEPRARQHALEDGGAIFGVAEADVESVRGDSLVAVDAGYDLEPREFPAEAPANGPRADAAQGDAVDALAVEHPDLVDRGLLAVPHLLEEVAGIPE